MRQLCCATEKNPCPVKTHLHGIMSTLPEDTKPLFIRDAAFFEQHATPISLQFFKKIGRENSNMVRWFEPGTAERPESHVHMASLALTPDYVATPSHRDMVVSPRNISVLPQNSRVEVPPCPCFPPEQSCGGTTMPLFSSKTVVWRYHNATVFTQNSRVEVPLCHCIPQKQSCFRMENRSSHSKQFT